MLKTMCGDFWVINVADSNESCYEALMRIFLVSAGSLFVCLISFWIVKLWGQSQVYHEYGHPMYSSSNQRIDFLKPTFKNLEADLKSKKFLYLDVAITQDQKLVIPKRNWNPQERPIGYSLYEDIKNDVFLVQDFKNILKEKKIIFNIIENTQAVHENFLFNMQQLGLERGENFIVLSPYEAPIKALKELVPSFIYGTTRPEIGKILALQSMNLIEAVNIRADMIVQPLLIRKHNFFSSELLTEISRRHKRIIVGPITQGEIEEAIKLKPYGLIIQEN